LKLWEFWQEARARATRALLYKLCRDNFLSYNRMREWEDIHAQLVRVMREWDFAPNEQAASGEQIHRALLPGLLSKIGMWNAETRIYTGARQTRFQIHPSSGLARKPPQWVMAAELVETSQLFARSVAKLDPAWLEKAGGALCKRSHGDPHWEMKAAQVVAREQVTLYGLPIVKDRKVAYAPFDPGLSRELFITHALVRHEYTTKGAFMEHNRRLLEDVQHLRDRARRSDMLADEYALWTFFDKRIPENVVSGATFEAWRRDAEARDPSILELSRADILLDEAYELSPERYPDQLAVRGATLPLAYRFDPGEDDDGITASVPLALLPQLDAAVLAWTIPGWHEVKLRALLDSLPKPLRKALAPLDDLARELAIRLTPFDGPMLPAVERAIYERTGERVPRDAWDLRTLPAYLELSFRVIDDHDKTIAHGRDLAELQRTLGHRAKDLWARAPRERHERTGLKSWDFDALPLSVTLDVGSRTMLAYPALVDTETAVDLRLLESAAAAIAATRDGLRRLFLLQLNTTLGKLEAQLPASLASGPLAIPGAPATPRRQIVLRALDDAFQLTDPDAFPRTKAAFAERLAEGRGRLPDVLGQLTRTAIDLCAELDKVRAQLKPLAGRPGVTAVALADIQTQLQRLIPPDLMRVTQAARLGHLPRYLKAILVRLQRLSHDPQKDQQKAAQVAPFWQSYQKLRDERQAKGYLVAELDELGWLLEEFRVQTFAPELKTAVPVSAQRLQDLWTRFAR
jgi:ATP-dependent helicase HrpA